ncbi:hypothetical protein CWS97_24350 [Klebsiella pneumoniae]|uniref:Uncharacterized protein n=1 Tax=Klebsiella pneumoniae TaxID=573 RepID=A0A6B2JBC2_KLEPN|nr:hypothetical protein [Klebsiella pneumoniae]NDR65484.1 hypothetical protein [Klebsiella pneumoniae]NDR86060.1 hypothetical protein [Klebsiella pneumoniae]NDS01714.1 hypothetical protein [Klebsiella pneumoniae]NDS08085.1 hypothetical protein [Klebsiella pneumoniae]
MIVPHFTVSNATFRNSLYDAYHIPLLNVKDIILLWNFTPTPFYTSQGLALRDNKKGDFRILKSPERIKVDTLKIC